MSVSLMAILMTTIERMVMATLMTIMMTLMARKNEKMMVADGGEGLIGVSAPLPAPSLNLTLVALTLAKMVFMMRIDIIIILIYNDMTIKQYLLYR